MKSVWHAQLEKIVKLHSHALTRNFQHQEHGFLAAEAQAARAAVETARAKVKKIKDDVEEEMRAVSVAQRRLDEEAVGRPKKRGRHAPPDSVAQAVDQSTLDFGDDGGSESGSQSS